jgi:hypothetical protein
VRDHYHQINSEEQLEVFITNVEKMNCESITPYLASAIMQKAQYTYLPYKKLSYFSKGKKQLESFIEKKPGNIEARYVRLLVQHQSPGFLGYNKNMKEDKNFIKLNIHKSSLPLNYQKKILHILDSIQINR